MKHVIRSRKTNYTAYAFKVEELNVSLPDGRIRDYDLVNHKDSVTIIPVDNNEMFWFVEQYRMGSESALLELPAGVMDDNESPEICAAREVREEIGMSAGHMQLIGSVYLAPGYSSELNHIFLATKLTPAPLKQDDDEFLTVKKFSKHDLMALIQDGGLLDSKSLAALYLYQLIPKN
jgi:ADP-ribose pyrophosphatase